MLEWLLRRSGPLSSSVAEAFAFVRSRPGLPAPDLQFHFAPAYFVDHGATTYDGHALTIAPVLVSPKSRGHVKLRSADPTAPPRILTNMLVEPEDMASMVAGVKIARDIASATTWRDRLGYIFGPPGWEPAGRGTISECASFSTMPSTRD
jgi:choline dehydrogenase-like flavoprotein